MTLNGAIEKNQISHSGCINIIFADYRNKKTFDVKPFNTANTKIISSCTIGFRGVTHFISLQNLK